jgi:hypothetical protein
MWVDWKLMVKHTARVYYLFFEESRSVILKGKATAGKAKASTLNMLDSIVASFIAGSYTPCPILSR